VTAVPPSCLRPALELWALSYDRVSEFLITVLMKGHGLWHPEAILPPWEDDLVVGGMGDR
jgi:hypothetical protein